jgi:anti-sigma-K factor RskA
MTPEKDLLYELYVLGQLEEPERTEIEEALRRNEPGAQARLRMALETNAILGTLPDDVAPSKALRRRILAIAEPAPSRLPWNLAWAALSACLVAGLIYTTVQRQGLQEQLKAREATLAQLRQGTGGDTNPAAKVFLSKTEGVLLIAANLAPLEAGRTYEMWVVPKAGGPRPAGLFKPAADGSAIHLRPGPVDLSDAAAIALSVEPDGGSPAPTTAPFLITPVAE